MYEGGSIRVPAAFNYLYGIRPSHGRMPYARLANSMEGQETIHSVVGPVAHSAAGQSCTLNTMKNELTKKKKWDRPATLHNFGPRGRALEL